MTKEELEEKIKKYNISLEEEKCEETDFYHHEIQSSISSFKEHLDSFLSKTGALDGTISTYIEHGTYGYDGGSDCDLIAKMYLTVFVPKNEEQLKREILEAELKEQKKKEQDAKLAKLKIENQKEIKKKVDEADRKLYEKLKKKFEK